MRQRMNKTLFATAIVLALTLTAAAAKKPSPYQKRSGPDLPPGQPVVPALCDPCLFYSGDLNPSDGQAAGFSDEDTLLVTGGSTYAPVSIPSGIASANLTGILFNIQADANFDPQSASYDIRQGVSSGNGGTEVASGTANITVATTGRAFLGLTEFSVLVTIPTVALAGGGEFWFNITPECTNGAVDGSCYVGRMFLSNTTQMANEQFGHASAPYQLYLNSSYFGYTFEPWCDLGLVNGECRFASFGLVGTVTR
jgi:hypothetical protein